MMLAFPYWIVVEQLSFSNWLYLAVFRLPDVISGEAATVHLCFIDLEFAMKSSIILYDFETVGSWRPLNLERSSFKWSVCADLIYSNFASSLWISSLISNWI